MAGNSLQAVLNRAKAANDKPKAENAPASAAPRRKAKAAAPKAETASRSAQPGRTGTKLIGGHFPPEVSTQLRIIAAEENTTMQALLTEALSDLFVKKGKKKMFG